MKTFLPPHQEPLWLWSYFYRTGEYAHFVVTFSEMEVNEGSAYFTVLFYFSIVFFLACIPF